MGKISWIHFSDLHLNSTGAETVLLRTSLPTYLANQNIRCDYAFCTGDIRYAPDGDFPADAARKIEEICRSVGVRNDCLFIVPGNHDISRDSSGRNDAIRNVHFHHDYDISGKYTPRDGKIDIGNLEIIAKGKEKYNEFIEDIYRDDLKRIDCYINYREPHFVITTDYINILHIDSTLTYAEYQEHDLIVGIGPLMTAIEQLDESKPTIILTHYSFDFLSRDEQDLVLLLLRQTGTKLWLAGHEHRNLARMQRDFFYELQCGNLLLETGARSCVLIGELDTLTGNGTIKAHAWYRASGWAEYPHINHYGTNNSVYKFNISPRIGTSIDLPKQELRRVIGDEVRMLLKENRHLFDTYGPTEKNMADILSEKSPIWESIIQSTIIPNNRKVVDLLNENTGLLTDAERDVYVQFKIHTDAFELNHTSGRKYTTDAARFPIEIYDILS